MHDFETSQNSSYCKSTATKEKSGTKQHTSTATGVGFIVKKVKVIED